MKLVRQINLWNNEGTADKVYEIDLCVVTDNQFIVNFRYGRRGTVLKEGSKTVLPLEESAAKIVFLNLIQEKINKGYIETDRFGAEFQELFQPIGKVQKKEKPAPFSYDTFIEPLSPNQIFVLEKLKAALSNSLEADEKWPLARIIWRAGVLNTSQAVPLLLSYTPKSTFQTYVLCWALGRCNNTAALPFLQDVIESKTEDYVVQIAKVAYYTLAETAQKSVFEKEIHQLAFPTLTDADYFTRLDTINLDVLPLFYLVHRENKPKRTLILDFIKTLPFKGSGNFRALRRLYKMAEFLDDSHLFGLLGQLFETTSPTYKPPTHWVQIGDVWKKQKNKHELQKPFSTVAWTKETAEYFKRRNWRYLKQLGNDENAALYTEACASFLIEFDANNQRQAFSNTRRWYERDLGKQWGYKELSETTHYIDGATWGTLNFILYKNSKRFERGKDRKSWVAQNAGAIKNQIPEREDAFPKLWNKQPDQLVRLLAYASLEAVHQFALKALKANVAYWRHISNADLIRFLSAPSKATQHFGFELIEERLNQSEIQEDLAHALLQSPLAPTRQLGLDYIEKKTNAFRPLSSFWSEIILSEYEDVHVFVQNSLSHSAVYTAQKTEILELLVEKITNFSADTQAIKALEASKSLIYSLFEIEITDLDISKIETLLSHPSENVQGLGAQFLLRNKIPAEELPGTLIATMIASKIPDVRSAGVGLFGKLPDARLLQEKETLQAFCLSTYPEIRAVIRPAIKRLAQNQAKFGREWVDEMLPFFKMTEQSEGLHTDLYLLFEESLSEHLGHISQEICLRFCRSKLPVRQKFGYLLLSKNEDGSQVSMPNLVQLADNPHSDTRLWAHSIFEKDIARVRYESEDALRLLDAEWDETRAFAFDFFKKHFTEREWTSKNLVMLCDSIRPDVQQYGRSLVNQFFKKEDGEQYLLELSQHPSQAMQLFTTNYLTQFAADKTENIQNLEFYFVSVLSGVNKGGVAKARVYHFLEQEALKNKEVATLVAKIINRQSATQAVADKAACLKILIKLKAKYPDLLNLLEIVKPESRT